MEFMRCCYICLFCCLLLLLSCTPKNYNPEQEHAYIEADNALWEYYEAEGERLMELYAEDDDLLYSKAVELEEYSDRRNRELAIEYSATPSGLRRCFMLRNDLSKTTLEEILRELPRDLRKSDAAKAIKEHIATEQIEVGMNYSPLEVVTTDGSKIEWDNYNGKNIFLLYGGLGCMGPSGRRDLAALREEYSKDDLAILIYYPVGSLEELQELDIEFASDYTFISELMTDYSHFKIKYGCQATSTCYFIDREGVVALKTEGLPDMVALRELIK